ncbi:MAG: FAD:protein FMN transferase [Oscillospiraceae bacterium]|jgi:thiamine biosynthesis lipoprotein|nr:FAD:protein FMN transferase [Oscillospiraceae bacterium]
MKKLALILTIAVILGGCSVKNSKYTAIYYDLFDTVTIISGFSDSEAEFDALAAGLYDELKAVHDACLAEEPPEALLALCEEYKAASGGTFDVTLGAVYALYKNGGEPSDIQLEAAKDVFQYDFGAIGKGYALDLAASFLQGKPFAGTISLGGSVAAIGRKPGTADGAWEIGIQDPSGDGLARTIALLPGQFTATSGTYERGNHIIDPRTCAPVISQRSLTIVANSGAVADFLSTALFVEPNEGLAEKYNAETFWLN